MADHRRDADIAAVAKRILDNASPRFALAGLSMGGYIAFAVLRLAPDRIAKLALLDTSAHADTPEQAATRKTQIAMAQSGRFGEIPEMLIPRNLHRNRQSDENLTTIVREMAMETGPEALVRQLMAIMSRPDSRPMLSAIRCPTLVLVGDGDEDTPPVLNQETADCIPGAKFTIIPYCGHLSTIEQPDAVNAALADCLGA